MSPIFIRRALITGGTGFVGSNLVRVLVKQGWSVDIIVRPSSNIKILSDLTDNIVIHRFKGDTKQMLEIVSEASPDIVFHVASMVVGEHKSEQLQKLLTGNITFGTQLLEAMSVNNIRNFVNTGTYWEHYENKDFSPVNLYAATKKAFRDIMQYYIEAHGIKAVTLKLFDPYGQNDPRLKLLNLLLRIAETGETLAMSPGEQQIDLVHIDDVIRAYEMAAKRLIDGKVEKHEIYGVASGQLLTLKDLVAIIEKITGKKINIEWGGKDYRSREVMLPWNHFVKPIGWDIQISLESGLKDLCQNNLQHRES